jgi:hypothetical protein
VSMRRREPKARCWKRPPLPQLRFTSALVIVID